ncbi:MAG: exodeoxyribonuclease VII large subunit [bacterium]|nr:exodeoxyribonuclease VII large subunit [Acidimicrobiia bacterium]MCY4649115.1 exodeoxyribonuclease VII large subunit [bacterium]
MNPYSSSNSSGTSAEETIFTVSELAGCIQEVLHGAFPSSVWVTGEVANLSRSNAGHVYLDLMEPAAEGSQDSAALLHSVIWESRRHAINQALRRANWGPVSDGDELKVRVWVDFYPPQGRVTLQIHEVDPHYTLGRWKVERERVVALLKKEGVFEQNKKLDLSVAPHRIGLITSAESNAYADFTSTLSESGLGWAVLFHHSGVQGDHARSSLVKALDRLSELKPDVICVVRGGGSATDLAVFDHETVARAVAGASVPVIAGIGHELDQTVSDLVAHRSERTPTACASWLVERVKGFASQVNLVGREIAEDADGLVRRHSRRLEGSPVAVAGAADGALMRCRQGLERSVQVLPAHVRPWLQRAEVVVASRQAALVRESGQFLKEEQVRLESAERMAEAYDPRRNLARGWSITRRRRGGVISSIGQVKPPEEIETWLSDGTVVSTVSETRSDRGTEGQQEVTQL